MIDPNSKRFRLNLKAKDIPEDPLSRKGFNERKRRLDVQTLKRLIRRDPQYPRDLTVWDFMKQIARISDNAVHGYRKEYEATGVCWVSPSIIIQIMEGLGISCVKPFLVALREPLTTSNEFVLRTAVYNVIYAQREKVYSQFGDTNEDAVNILTLFWEHADEDAKRIAKNDPAALQRAFEAWVRDGLLINGKEDGVYVINLMGEGDFEIAAFVAVQDFCGPLLGSLDLKLQRKGSPAVLACIHNNLKMHLGIAAKNLDHGMDYVNNRRQFYEAFGGRHAGSIGYDSGQRCDRTMQPFLQVRYLLKVSYGDDCHGYHAAIKEINEKSYELLVQMAALIDPANDPEGYDRVELVRLFTEEIDLYKDMLALLEDLRAELKSTGKMLPSGQINPDAAKLVATGNPNF